MAQLDPGDTALAVISKSGETVETAALFRLLLPWLQARRPQDWKERVVLVTDRVRGTLRPLAAAHGLPALPVPDDVGGRFSVLTAVGVLPAAFLGLDVPGLLAGARDMAGAVSAQTLAENPAWRWAALHDAAWGHANVTVLMPYCDGLRAFGEWFQQLWGESLGKPEGDGAYGWTPVLAMGPVDQHSQLQLYQEGPRDKIVTLLGVEDRGEDLAIPMLSGPEDAVAPWLADGSLGRLIEAERIGVMAALVEAGRPVVDLRFPRVDAPTLGGAILFFEAATAIAGLMRGLDPFDQPGVEAGKKFASGLLGRPEYRERKECAERLLDL
jgi:glucose-6-phosphate isomerase